VPTENLPQEVSLSELQSDCQQRWDQAGGEAKLNQDVEPSSLPQATRSGPQPGTEPTPEHAVTPASGAK
jgi:hypothetical protein